MIPKPNIRYLVTFWREIQMTLKMKNDLKPDDAEEYWKKKDFQLFPKHKMDMTKAYAAKAVKVYKKLFGYADNEEAGPFKKDSCFRGSCSDYGTKCIKHPFDGIRSNYAD